MKKTIKILFISLALFGCLSKNIELKPVQKKTDCLISKISTISGTKPNLVIETQNISYDNNGNPSDWTVIDEKGGVQWNITMEYENNRLKSLTRKEFNLIRQNLERNSVKTYDIKADFSEMIVREVSINARLQQYLESNPQKLYFIRNKQQELKFLKSNELDKKDTNKVMGPAAYYVYNLATVGTTTLENKGDIFENVVQRYNFLSSGGLIEAKGYWDNVRNPFSSNIWLSLIANYRDEYGTEGGDWSRNMQSIDPKKGFITTYETNTEGFPCRLTAKNRDFTPYPLEVRYYYLNCDCK